MSSFKIIDYLKVLWYIMYVFDRVLASLISGNSLPDLTRFISWLTRYSS
jgi:hypothetical protein